MIALLWVALSLVQEPGTVTLTSDNPLYELVLPPDYAQAIPRETPARFVRSVGREPWARISALVVASTGELGQNPAGITAGEILPLVSPPAGATWTFSRTKWKNLEIGVIEYRAVVKDLPVIGLSTILPLRKKALCITVYAPDPLEKEIHADFEQLLSRITRTETTWYTDEELRKIATLGKVTTGGVVLAALYPIAWGIFFRGSPLMAHWFRTIWLFLIALLLFIPISSPGQTSLVSNLLVNAMVPLLFIVLTVRRLKLGIDAD